VLRVPTFVVIGGGTIGDVYVRQLLRAVDAGRLLTDRILVVDRDPQCLAAGRGVESVDGRPAVVLERASWSEWLDARLAALGPRDHLVPYHWAPHLLRDWLARQMAASGAMTSPAATLPARGLPFEATTAAGDRALSYASWTCPPFCIEPALCPHTRGPKDWSLARDLEVVGPEDPVGRSGVFQCLHLVYGIARSGGGDPGGAGQAARRARRGIQDLARGDFEPLPCSRLHPARRARCAPARIRSVGVPRGGPSAQAECRS
jgi:hypothetical protein